MKTIKIMVCAHKQTPRISDPMFPAILLGSKFADDELKEAYKDCFWDSQGDNIGDLHPYTAELTSIYWAWKNYDKLGDPDYIGLFHYRRFFNFGESFNEEDLWKCAFFDFNDETRDRFGWHEDNILKFCEGYDLVLPLQEQITDPHDWSTPCDLETHYKHAHYPEDFDLAMDVIRTVRPEYTNAVDRAIHSQTGHFCNMYIMTRELFFDFAKWLFDVYFAVKEKLPLETEKYASVAQRRVLGFLGERLFNIWINYQREEKHVRIRETQRLTGYLSEPERQNFSSTYGLEEYNRIFEKSHSAGTLADLSPVDVGNGTMYPCRNREKPDVSVLVSVYNVEPYLRECLDSLVNQTLRNIEFVVVDNCSTDGCWDIMKYYYDHDPRFTLVKHHENEGLPGSRNTAMRFARGKYLAFIDSDDICRQDMFRKLFEKGEELGADIVTCSVMAFEGTLDKCWVHRPLQWYENSGYALPLSQRPQQLMEPAAWCKLFRTDYIKSLDFFEYRRGTISWEDVPAMTSAFIQTDKIATVCDTLYFYRQRSSGNLSNNMTKRHTRDFISGVKMQKDILEKHHYHDDGVLSYVEEFKFLFFEWVLSKMKKSDIPYLFHHVPGMFKWKDRRYLKRLFDAYPRRKIEYYLLMTRSSLAYFAAKGALHLGRKVKRGLKSVFKIEREGCYTVFRLFGRKHRIFRKKVALDSMAWYEQKARQDERLVWQANSERDARVQEAEARYAALIEEKNELAARLSETEGRLESYTGTELIDKSSFETYVKALRDHIEFIEEEKAGLAASLKETRQKASETESQMLHYSEKLAEAAQSIVDLNDRCLAYQKANEDAGAQLAQLNKENYGFFRSVWTTGWMKRWKEFYHRNYLRIEDLKDRLKAGLDDESRQIVDRQCFRTFELLPTQEYDELFKYDHLKIYTQAEREGAAQKLDEEEIRSRFNIAPGDYLEVPVFRFHCGLKFLPEQVLDTIRGRDVIDGGAYWGDSALVFNTYGPKSITAFEPQPETFGKLEATIANNGLRGVITPVQMGLGEVETDAVLYSNDMLSASNLSNVNAVKTEGEVVENPIRITSIDSYAAAHDLNVGLIKLDVEGNELSTMRGAMETIRRDKPVLLISIYHTPEDFFEIKPMLEAEELGYHFMVRKLVYADLVTEIMLIGYID